MFSVLSCSAPLSLFPPLSRNAPVDPISLVQLEWLNDTSEVVYFNKPGLDKFVILHPLHLMWAIKLIVRYDRTGDMCTLTSLSAHMY